MSLSRRSPVDSIPAEMRFHISVRVLAIEPSVYEIQNAVQCVHFFGVSSCAPLPLKILLLKNILTSPRGEVTKKTMTAPFPEKIRRPNPPSKGPARINSFVAVGAGVTDQRCCGLHYG